MKTYCFFLNGFIIRDDNFLLAIYIGRSTNCADS